MKRAKPLKVAAGTVVAFQGEMGAFSQRASHNIFGPDIDPLPCTAFEDVFEAVVKKKAKLAVIPIENSLAGSVLQNFDLLVRNSLEAVAETLVRIELHLIAHPRSSMKDVRQVYSHPVALAQCQKTLRRFRRIEQVPFYDTAGSVKYLKENDLTGAAAVASSDAARLYGMKILMRGIEDNPENYTRFLALAPRGRKDHHRFWSKRRTRDSLPGVVCLRAAQHRADENRIAPHPGQAMGVPLLYRPSQRRARRGLHERATPSAGNDALLQSPRLIL